MIFSLDMSTKYLVWTLEDLNYLEEAKLSICPHCRKLNHGVWPQRTTSKLKGRKHLGSHSS
jgi:hypothetical protein